MASDLKYLRNRDLRERISRMVGIDPGSRYRDDHGAGMPKVVVVEVARELGVERVDDCDLEALYRGICDAVDKERPSSTGNLWGLRREVLKEIVRRLQQPQPAEKLVADGGAEQTDAIKRAAEKLGYCEEAEREHIPDDVSESQFGDGYHCFWCQEEVTDVAE